MMQFAVVIRGILAVLGLFGVNLSEDVTQAIEQHAIGIVNGVLGLILLWPVVVAGWRKARGGS